MRFTTTLSVLLLALHAEAIAFPGEDPEAAIIPSIEGRDASFDDVSPASPLLTKRACKYNGCKCNSRGKQLTVCGNCVWSDTGKPVVTKKRKNSHIYECSPSGRCCDYGVGSDCGSGSARCKVNK